VSPITHPEFFYGFIGVALLWQVVFVLVATDPLRYRPIMLVSVLEKLAYTVPLLVLYSPGNVNLRIVQWSLVDPIFGILFAIAYVRTRHHAMAWASGGA
jgi:hypothetical protein